MNPGIYTNMPAAQYHAAPGASHSRLEVLTEHCPAMLRWQMENPEKPKNVVGVGDALEFGSAFHDIILLPERFADMYTTLPFKDMRTKAAQEWVAGQNKIILNPEASNKISAMAMAIDSHMQAKKLVAAATYRELSVFWNDSATGVLCKMRADMVITFEGPNKFDGAIVVDLKTTPNPSPEAFGKAVESWGYHRQAAYYLDGLNEAGIPAESFGFIPISKDPPHVVAVYALSQRAISFGREQNRDLLDRYAECEKSGVWPGYDKIESLDLPEWSYRKSR